MAFPATSTHTYTTSGTFTVSVVASVAGGSASCTDTMTLVIEILPSPTATANISPGVGCDTVNAVFINTSSGAATYFWEFGTGDTSSLQNPPPVAFVTTGQHVITLTVTSNNGCVDSTTAIVAVYDTPITDFTADN
ncbi:MAG TPA: cell surface protein, partial [Flavobacteriales bacterium]|nr:cell surface protein [Flavobacteriales bacterium]